jgi:hypothetical protein
VPPRLRLRPGSALLPCLGALACAHAASSVALPTPSAVVEEDPCALSAVSDAVPDSLSVALAGTIDLRHAPSARSPAERFVFRQLFESLIRMDCTGAIRPGLAVSWSARDSGRVWVFTLRPGATFWDESPVVASDVIAAWNARSALPEGMTAVTQDDGKVQVMLDRPAPSVPRALADPAWAVTRAGPNDGWPMGTSRFQVDTAGGVFRLAPRRGSGAGPVVVIRAQGSGDLRDMLDAGADILVTSDPAALSYAAERTGLTTLPLPWDSTYVLLSQGEVALSDSERVDLSRDVVRVTARAAMGPQWWTGPGTCGTPSPATFASTPVEPQRPTWVAAQGDGPGRDLLERLVALRRNDGDTAVRALTLGAEAFAASLQADQSAAYVVAVPRQPIDPCRAMRDFLARAPWAQAAVILPLVDIRPHAIVRRGAAAFTVEWDGTLRLR